MADSTEPTTTSATRMPRLRSMPCLLMPLPLPWRRRATGWSRRLHSMSRITSGTVHPSMYLIRSTAGWRISMHIRVSATYASAAAIPSTATRRCPGIPNWRSILTRGTLISLPAISTIMPISSPRYVPTVSMPLPTNFTTWWRRW